MNEVINEGDYLQFFDSVARRVDIYHWPTSSYTGFAKWIYKPERVDNRSYIANHWFFGERPFDDLYTAIAFVKEKQEDIMNF